MTTLDRRDLLRLGAVAGTGLLDAAPAIAQGADAPRRGGTLTVALTPEPANLFPANSVSNPVIIAGTKVNESLIRLDWDYNMHPVLAESWDISPDRLTWRFNLRRGVKWHDGRDFTSADVAFTLNEVWKKLHGRGINSFRNVAAVETPDAHTATLKLSAPIPFLHTVLSAHEATIVAQHIYQGTNILQNPANQRPVGTGPFRFREWSRGSHIIYDRNPTYWDPGRPYLDRLVFRLIPDAAGRASALENREVLLAGPNPVPLGDTQRLGAVPHLEVVTRGHEYSAPMIYLQCNFEHPILSKPAVRQALSHAIDLGFIERTVMFGFAKAPTGVISSDVRSAYTPDVPQYAFDLARAEAMLDQAGHPRGADGIRFAVTLDAYTLGEHYVRISEYLRESFGRLGVRVTLRTEDAATWVRRIYTQYDYEMTVYGALILSDPTVGLQRFLYSGAIQRGLPFSNSAMYRNARVDAIFDAAQSEADQAKRTQLWHELQRIAATDLPLIPLAEWRYSSIGNRRVRDWIASPHMWFENFSGVWLAPA